MTDQAAQEFEAIKAVLDALQPLDEEARTRVLTYIASLLGIDAKAAAAKSGGSGDAIADEADEAAADEAAKEAPTFSTFARRATMPRAPRPTAKRPWSWATGYRVP